MLSQFVLKTKRLISILFLGGFCLTALSACTTDHTEVSNWWYDQQWESASAGGETDQ